LVITAEDWEGILELYAKQNCIQCDELKNVLDEK